MVNYLAHAFLSNNEPDLLVGNFIADHLRGNDFSNLSAGIVNGIRLHRRIDSFTDQHPLFRSSKRLFYAGFEKYSGILVDIYFDHFLARDFDRYAAVSLDAFSRSVYEVYSAHRHLLPESSERFLGYLVKNNIYQSYATEPGIMTVLHHLSNRIRHNVRLDESLLLFQKHRSDLENNFRMVIDDLLSSDFLKEPIPSER